MSRALDLSMEVLFAKQDLAELCAAYSRAVDRLDEPALVDLFHSDAIIDSGVLRGDPRFFAREFVAWVRSHARVVYHTAGNHWFAVDGDRAKGESYVIAIARLLDGSETERDVLTAGRYLDRFERRHGKWRFSERQFVLDHSVAINHAQPALLQPLGDESHGSFAPTDPSCRFWTI